MAVKHSTCPRCLTGGFNEGKAHGGRPEFTCTSCDYKWTYGWSGGPYKKGNKDERKKASKR